MITTTHYYTARRWGRSFRGYVYTYDSTGDREITVWQSEELYGTENEAINATSDWLCENNIEAELE